MLVYVPIPLPLVVFEFEVVGFCDVLQQTPRAVTADPPSVVTLFSEQVAVVAVIPIIWPVVTVGFVVGGSGFSCGPQEFNINPIASNKKIFFIIDGFIVFILFICISSFCKIVKKNQS